MSKYVWDPENHARNSDPATSKAAARVVDSQGQLATYEAVFAKVYPVGLTAEEAALSTPYGTDGGNYTKRVSDLLNAGIVEPTGHTRAGSSGRQQRVLVWVPETMREIDRA